jgi:hypothetical protein
MRLYCVRHSNVKNLLLEDLASLVLTERKCGPPAEPDEISEPPGC